MIIRIIAQSLIFISMCIISASASIAEPLSGPGATLSGSPPSVVEQQGVADLSGKLKAAIFAIERAADKIEEAADDEVYSKLADFGLAVLNKTTNIKFKVDSKSSVNSFQRRLSGYLKDSLDKDPKSIVKDFGKGVAESIIVGAAIDFITAYVKEETGSLAQSEFAWLAMRTAESVVFSNGNPVAVAVGQAGLLLDVAVKDVKASKEAWSAYSDLKKAKGYSEKMRIEEMYLQGMLKAAEIDDKKKRQDAVNALALRLESAINDAEYIKYIKDKTVFLNDLTSGQWKALENYRNFGVMSWDLKMENVPPPEKPVLSPIYSDRKDIVVGSINNDINSDAIKNTLIGELPSTSSAYWHGNFVLNYLNGSGIFTTFGYGDGEFSTTNASKPGANTAATLTYYHLGERHYQVDIGSVDYPGDYSYTAWGSWTEGDQRLAAFEADYAHHSGTSKLTPWVAVQRMTPEDVNRLSGTATYSGVLSGVMIGDAGASGFQSGTGMFGMTANFNNNTVTGAVIVMRGPSSPAWAAANFSTSLNGGVDGGLKFNSQLTGTGISNAVNWHSQIRGEFGGPQANEAGGMWAITKTDGSQATGTFHAKKDTNPVAP